MNEEQQFNIRQIQRALRVLHKNGMDIPVVYEDGIFGPETERGIIAFQLQSGLPPTGIVDYNTWVLLMETANEFIRKNAEPFPIFPYISDEESTVFPDEEGKIMWFLQAMLASIAEKYSGFDAVRLNGKNDEATRNAVRNIHGKSRGEATDGRLSKSTWNSVARLFNAVHASPEREGAKTEGSDGRV